MAMSEVKTGALKRRKDFWDKAGEVANVGQALGSLYGISSGLGGDNVGGPVGEDVGGEVGSSVGSPGEPVGGSYGSQAGSSLTKNKMPSVTVADSGYSSAILRRLRNQRSV